MIKRLYSKPRPEYSHDYKRAELKYPVMAKTADHYKSIKGKVSEDRDTIMVYFPDGARLFMSKKSGVVQFYFIGTGRYDVHEAHVFQSVESLISAFETYKETHQGTAIFSDVLSEIDKDEMDDYDDEDEDF